MKALTLTQPWATLIAIGAKHIETRSWATSYRGPLAIHAAAGYGKGGARGHKALCGTEPFCSVLNAACKQHYDDLDKSVGVLRAMAEHPFMPMGAIVATGYLVGCEETDWVVENNGIYKIIGGKRRHWALTDQERAFGDYSPGRYAWLLADVQALPEPIPAKGALGLWQYAGTL
jgi:activating signal cointegrator 1